MPQETPQLKAISTDRPDNRFEYNIYFRVLPEGTFIPVERKKKRAAQITFTLWIEYPFYAEELEMKRRSMRYDENHGSHYLDIDNLTEERIRRCLVKWDLHDKIPEFTVKLTRMKRLLDDESINAWQKLPPLVRKEVAMAVNRALGVA